MTGRVPPRARELARGLKERFEADQKLAIALNEAQDRLMAANTELWSGLHPDAIALLYDTTTASGQDGRLKSKVTIEMELGRRAEADLETVETEVLVVVQRIHDPSRVCRLPAPGRGSATSGDRPRGAAARVHRRADRRRLVRR